MKKRWLGILLTIGMVLTLLPTAAWAVGETTVAEVSSEDALKTALSGNANIVRLTDDITISESLTVSRTVTLDLNDHVLTITGEDSFITVSGEDIELTLADSATTKTERKFSKDSNGVWTLDDNGKETVSGGVITGGKTYIDNYGALAVDSGVLIEEGVTLNVTDATVNAPVRNKLGTIAGSGIFNSTVINEDKITGGTFYGPVANYKGQAQADNEIRGGTFYGAVANGYNYIDSDKGEVSLGAKGNGLITDGTFYGKVTNAFYSTISGGSFYGEVDNRERTDFYPYYQGTLAGGTFYAGNPGTIADGCCTVTYEYPFEETYAIQIVKKDECATKPVDPERSDFTFDNWYASPYPNEPTQKPYDFGTPVKDDLYLYGNWANTFYGIHITDKNGNVYNITDKNADDVLGDGKVVYTPGYANEDTTNDDWKKALSGETVEGLQLPKLTLNGANLQQIEIDTTWISNQDMKVFSMMLQLELVGNNTVEYNGDSGAAISADYLIVIGSGSLNATATGENAAAIAISNSGGGYYQHGGDVTLNGSSRGLLCSDAYFEFASGKLTTSSSKYALYCDLNDLRFKITSDTTTFYYGSSEETKFEIKAPFNQKNISEQLLAAAKEGKLQESEYGLRILYAQLTSNHTVTFDSAGGSEVESLTVPYGGTISPTSPTRSGYTFAGWYLGDSKYDFDTAVTADLTLTAHWTRNSSGGGGGTTTYTLTFDTNGGSALSALRLARGSTVDLARYVPERSGHVFTGWYADAALTQPIETVTLSASTTVYAGWRAETGDLPFTDVGADAWYRDDVQYVYDAGLMTGTTADRFAPDGSMTRAMLVTVLWRQAGSPVVNYAMDFSDVAEGAWYAEAVRWAASEGVVGGYGDGRFGPDDPITREQLATILFRHLVGDGAAELADWLRPYADADQIGAYAVPAMQWAVGHGVLKGDGDRLDPQGTATRAQVAAVLHRALAL